MARPKLAFTLTDEQRRELERVVKAPATPQKLVRRARVALLAAKGEDNAAIAAELETSRVTVGLWRQRFLDAGLAGMAEAARPGRPATIDPTKARRVLTEVVQPPKHRARWSCRQMARHVGLSKDAVQRLWAANDLKPHITRTFKLSNDPHFEQKFWDVIGLYLDPPARAVVLCCDEKSQCQALERTQPGLPLGQGHICTRTHDYYRHGTVTLFAALNYLNGKILAERAPRHRHQEWLKFLKEIDAQVPAEFEVHLILDNYATHKHPKVLAWVAKHSRFHLHFTPTSSSWLNLVERFFRDLSQDVVLPGSFTSVGELTDAIWSYLAERNLHPKRYEWNATGYSILEKIQRAREALAQQQKINKDINETLH
ncbi:MAG: IS630 family transposase [Nitrosospira sp.]